ncbi:S41 family peptidase [Flavobacterium sp. N502540]|uniref:S41 family peptidase n=1 Tax=Flavobacterium sp. N502540 TaxID=2986838 RepID=UPI002225AE3E|nr:S41 family peptidase [Flavobacterium sp. N502540]
MKGKISLWSAMALFFINVSVSSAQGFDFRDLKAKDYMEDLALLKEIIEKQHPDPFKFITKEQWENHFKKSYKELDKEPTYLKFLNCIPKIKDGHFSIYARDEFLDEYMKEKYTYFPVSVIILENRMFVNTKNSKIPFLSEITEINKRPISDIINEIAGHVQGEGNIKSSVEDFITNDFSVSYSVYINSGVNSFEVRFKNSLSGNTVVNLEAIDYYELYSEREKKIAPLNKLELSSSIDYRFYKQKSTGKLTINTFDISEAEAYQKFKDFFTKIKEYGYENVIIDVRTNRGGNPQIAAVLYSFIASGNFRNEFNYKAKAIKFVHPEFLVNDNGVQVPESEVKSYENFIYQRFDLKDEMYIGNQRANAEITEDFPADKGAFSGKVYVLTSGNTYSASVYFAKLIVENKRGIIVGKETGGSDGNTFAGYFLNYKLPKTKSTMRFSFTELFFGKNFQKVDTGVLPDKKLLLEERLSYLSQEKDPEVAYIFEKLIDQ